MPNSQKEIRSQIQPDELTREQLLDDIEDLHVRLVGVDGRDVLMLILKSVVAANPNSDFEKDQTRLNKIEELLFGNRVRHQDKLPYEDILIFMYRQLLKERLEISKDASRTKTIKGGILKVAELAIAKFHPELAATERQSREDQDRRETLLRRYKEEFSSQRTDIRHRYYDLLYDGEEAKIVAGVLLRILAAARLNIDPTIVEQTVINVSEQEIEEFEREFDLMIKE